MALIGEDMYKYYTFAKYLAYEAGDILKHYFLNSNLKEEIKKDKTIVTIADKTSEDLIRKEIKKIFPNHSILGEEKGLKKGNEWEWVIDPLDGTNNFYRGIPFFNVSIGLKYKNEYVVGVVYNPMWKMMFSAYKNGGAFLNNKKITCKKEEKKIDEIFVTFCSSKNKEVVKKISEFYEKLRPNVNDLRKLGSSALEICYVAWGKTDIYLGYDIKPWDFAGAIVIAKEAGCEIYEGEKLVISKPGIYKKIKEFL